MSKHFNKGAISALSVGTVINTTPIIQMFSDREVLIECANSIEYYDEKHVQIYSGKLTVTVLGDSLEIRCLSDKNLSVTGCITSIEFKHN